MRRAFAAAMIVFGVTGCLALTEHNGAWPCEKSTDCDVGQVCRRGADSTLTCLPSLDCTATADCAKVGSGWTCVASVCQPPPCGPASPCSSGYDCIAKTCLKSCALNSECPSPDQCASDSHCHHCAGTPTPCESLTSCTSPGCTENVVACSGKFACGFFLTEGDCGAAPGCSWDTFHFECTGESACPAPGALCGDLSGCTATKTCTGNAGTSCAGLYLEICTMIVGCVVQ